MRVVLDGQPLNISRPTLAEALRAALASAEGRGAMVISAHADGEPLTKEQLSNPSDEPGSIAVLEFVTEMPGALVERSLRDAAEALEQSQEPTATAARAIQEGRTAEGIEQLHGVLATWQMVRDVVDRGGRLVKMNFETVDLAGVDAKAPMGACVQALKASLTEIKTALANEDWSLLGDVVGYNLEALGKDWKVVLTALADHVGRSSMAERKRGA